MSQFMKILITVVSLIVSLYGAYHLILIVYMFQKEQSYPHFFPEKKFAILIPARNEEAVIQELLISLQEQEYPQELYDVYVAINHCSDHTAEVAQAHGAQLIECDDKVRCKGDVLRECFDLLTSSQYNYDAFAVFDADNVADKLYLARMNDALCSGVRIAQGQREIKNPYDSWVSSCYGIYFTLINRLFNHARSAAHLSTFVGGTGFVLTPDVLHQSGGWRTMTLSEDTEYSLGRILSGEKIAYVKEAITYDEQPVTLSLSFIQRQRWSSGIMQLCGLYAHKFIKGQTRHTFWQDLDCVVMLSSAYIQLLSIVPLCLNLFSLFLVHDVSAMLSAFLIWLFGSYLGSTFLAWFILSCNRKLQKKDWLGIFTFWLFVMSWLPINLKCLFKKTTKWYEIKHTRTIRQSTSQAIK